MPLEPHPQQTDSIRIKGHAIRPSNTGSIVLSNAIRAMYVSISFSLADGFIGADLEIARTGLDSLFMGMREDSTPPELSLFTRDAEHRFSLDGEQCIVLYQSFVDGNSHAVSQTLEKGISELIARSILLDYADSALFVPTDILEEGATLILEFRLQQGQVQYGTFIFEISYEEVLRIFPDRRF
jgi:hypothetical protein